MRTLRLCVEKIWGAINLSICLLIKEIKVFKAKTFDMAVILFRRIHENWWKKIWFDKKFQDVGVAEVEGTVNGCPTQVIVVQVAGYIPATYDPKSVQSWRDSLNNLNSVIPSWENAKGKGWVDEGDLIRLLDLLYKERTIATDILAKEEARLWLTKADNNSIEEYNRMANESEILANKLNGKMNWFIYCDM